MAAGTCSITMETSIHRTSDAEEKEDSCFSDDDDDDDVYLVTDDDDDDDDIIYQEFDELNFFQLPDTKSVVSDDSFYPPDSSVTSQRSQSAEGPEPLTLFMACCSNNAIIVKIMIRQGVSAEQVREVDKNNRELFTTQWESTEAEEWCFELGIDLLFHQSTEDLRIMTLETMGLGPDQLLGFVHWVHGRRETYHQLPGGNRSTGVEETQCFFCSEFINTFRETGIHTSVLTGLIVACYQGFVDVVIALSHCPYVDVNWQDSEGNTALMTAAQAGHVKITNFLLNYFSGVDIELRNCHGFTAVTKAAVQGRTNCVQALMMSGADVEVRDYGRKMTPLEWARFTGHYETARMIQRLMARPCAEQFCDSFRMEWPKLSQLVRQAQEPQPCWRRLTESICGTFNLGMRMDPLEEGVLHYMVRLTTALASPLVATACSTVCPGSPPCVGKHRPAVSDILRDNDKRAEDPKSLENHKRLFQDGHMALKEQENRCTSLQFPALPDVVLASSMALRRNSLLPLHMIRRRSVCPGLVVPKVRLCKAPPPTYTPEGNQCWNKDSRYLQVPKWRYKALKEEREQEKMKR